MTRRHLGIIALLTTMIFLSGCGKTAITDTDQKAATANPKAETIMECRRSCITATGVDASKRSDCLRSCEDNRISGTDDLADCDMRAGTGSKTSIPRDICIQEKAMRNKNPEYCKSITEAMMKDTCYMQISQITKQQDICENISNESIKGICLKKTTE